MQLNIAIKLKSYFLCFDCFINNFASALSFNLIVYNGS